jgi:hypothetical protein
MRYPISLWLNRGALAALFAAALIVLSLPQPASAAKPPNGKTYFTVFFGLDEPYDLGTECFVFGESGVCSTDGQICGSWSRQENKGKQTGFSFELSFLEDGLPTTMEGQARVDSRGNRSSIAGAGRIAQAGTGANFSFAGREVGAARCFELLEESPADGDETFIVGSGILVTEPREVEDFAGVVLNGVGEVEIRHGNSDSLSITADDNILPHLTSEVRNGRLFLGTEPGIRFQSHDGPRYSITVRELDEITVSGVAGVDARGIDTDLLTIDISGVAVVKTRGEADRQNIVIEGVNTYDGRDLASRIVTVDIAGVSSAIVRVSDELNGKISGPSVLEYIGNPVVNVNAAPGSTVRRFGG